MQKMLYRIERCQTNREFRLAVKNYIKSGYVIDSFDDTSALLVKRKRKNHARAAALTAWWTLGIANIIYAIIPPKTEDEVMVILENE